MNASRFLLALGLAACGLVATTLFGAGLLLSAPEPKAVGAELIAVLPYAFAAAVVLRFGAEQDAATARRATLLILAVAAVLRLMLVFLPPDSSDIYRYVWDGRVQAAGINPYRFIPADPALAGLRDAAVYPNINRAGYAPTIYPPAAQMIYAAAGLVGGGVTTVKLIMVGFEAVTIAALLALLARRGISSTRVLLYAWHPLPLFEFAGSGHIDAAAIALMMLAFLFADRGWLGRSGALLAAATVTKFFPIVLAPALYRRWDWRAPAAGLATVLLLYLPYLSVGTKVFGFLSGYAHEEALDDGTGFFLLGFLDQQIDLPSWARPAYLAVGLGVLLAVAVAAIGRPDTQASGARPALFLLTAFTVITTPHLAWYFTWTVPLLCLVPRASVLYLTCAAALLYWQAHAPDQPIYSLLIYLPFYTILLGELAVGGVLRFKESRLHVRHA